MPKSRLFVGTFLSAQQKDLFVPLGKYPLPGVNFVRPEKLHLTWMFLGDADDAQIAQIEASLQSLLAKETSFALCFNKCELWFRHKEPRYLVLEPDGDRETREELKRAQKLSTAIRSSLESYLGRPDAKPFRPHITIARLRAEKLQSIQKFEKLLMPESLGINQLLPLTQRIQMVSLIKSHRGPSGDDYVTIRDFPLASI